MTKEMKNRLAYQDCVELGDPSFPSDAEYMEYYRFWREVAKFPEDEMYGDCSEIDFC